MLFGVFLRSGSTTRPPLFSTFFFLLTEKIADSSLHGMTAVVLQQFRRSTLIGHFFSCPKLFVRHIECERQKSETRTRCDVVEKLFFDVRETCQYLWQFKSRTTTTTTGALHDKIKTRYIDLLSCGISEAHCTSLIRQKAHRVLIKFIYKFVYDSSVSANKR